MMRLKRNENFEDLDIALEPEKANHIALIYLLSTLAVFIIMCCAMGQPSWIYKIFLDSTVKEITGGTPRLVVDELYNTFISSMMTNEDFMKVFRSRLYAILLPVGEFSCIDSLIWRLVKQGRLAAKTTALAAGFILQALIALSWTDPVTPSAFKDAVYGLSGYKQIDNVFIFAFICVLLLISLHDGYTLNEAIARIPYLLMAPMFTVLYLVIHIFLLTLFYAFISFLVNCFLYHTEFSLYQILYVFMLILYVILIRGSGGLRELGGLKDRLLTSKLVSLLVKKCGFGEIKGRKESGEFICVGLSVTMIVECFVLYFRLT